MKKEHEIAGKEILSGLMNSVGAKTDTVNPACVPPVDPTVPTKDNVYGRKDTHKATTPSPKKKR